MTPNPSPLPLDEGKRLPALDGLRGLAVLLVLLDHASDADLRLFPGADMNRAGKYGVYLFFVLSAFLLAHLLLLRPSEELVRARTWLNYFVRRILRIFPLYAIVLVVLTIIHKLQPHDIVTHLLLLDGKRQFWTIPVEVKYYFVLPLVVLAISSFRGKNWGRGIISSLGAAIVAGAIFLGEQAWSLDAHVYLYDKLEPFLLGTIAAIAHQAMVRRSAGPSRFAPWWEAIAFAALIATLVRVPSLYNEIFFFLEPVRKFGYDSPICGVLWTLVLLGVLHGTGYLRRLFSTRPLRYLGVVSYSAYLWHIKFLSDVDDMKVPVPLRLLIFLALVISVASVSYFLIERPLSRIRFDGEKLRAKEPSLPVP